MRILLALLLLFPQIALAIPKVHVLDGDIPTWLIEDHTLPIVHVTLHFPHAGSAYDPADKQGLAELSAALLQEGAAGMDAAAFQAYLNRNALQLSVRVGRDSLTVRMGMLREHMREGMRALTRLLGEPTLSPDAFERVKAQMIASLALQKQSPTYHANRAMAKALYGDHPYAQAGNGTEETLQAITLEDVQTRLAKAIDTNALRISAAGNIRAERLEELIEETIETLPEAEAPYAMLAATKPIEQSAAYAVRFDGPQSQIRFAMPSLSRDDPDFYAAHVLSHMLGGNGLTSILAEAIRQERGLTYGVYTWLDVSPYTAQLRGEFSTATATRAEAIEVLNETLDNVYTQGFTQAQLDKSKAYIIGAFPLSLDSTGSLASYLQVMQYYDLGTDYLNKRNDYFQNVTLEQVNRLAKNMLDPNRRLIVWAGRDEVAK